MKRSEINDLIRSAERCFWLHGWALPPSPKWDVTDFGIGDWRSHGLVLINLAEEPEYCEKLMYAKAGMTTPAHTHNVKKEDIVCRWGVLHVTVWNGVPDPMNERRFDLQVNGKMQRVFSGETLVLRAGERVTLVPGIYHSFVPSTPECIIGEVSTANDDEKDNIFASAEVGRFPMIEEDEEPAVLLVSDR